jgi:hypothetical protein
MKERNAYQLLFTKDFGSGPLFKNQGELAFELINTKNSHYYTDKADKDYFKKLGNLKVYVSQLFSDNTRRTVTPQFKQSLFAAIVERNKNDKFDTQFVTDEIISDLIEKNTPARIEIIREPVPDVVNEFYSNLTNASYISVFTARELILNKTSRLVDSLIEGLITSLFEGTQNKWYRFNFPLEQLCTLFWMGVRKELAKYIGSSRYPRQWMINTLYENKILPFAADNIAEHGYDLDMKISSEIVQYLSNSDIITVFYLQSPVYSLPIITLNPNDRQAAQTYCVFQSSSGEDQLHKMTRDEMFFWSYFVWDNLRVNNSGKQLKYSPVVSSVRNQ